MTGRAIIVGASSGIGKALAERLSEEGYVLGLAARRVSLLMDIKDALPGVAFVREMDVSQPAEAETRFERLVDEMEGVDLVIIAAGVGYLNPDLDFALEKQTIETNVAGFAVVADAAYRYFQKNGSGHLVGISSIAALRGSAVAPAYNASKAFVSNYLEGLRVKARKDGLDITVTDIRPGFVDTAMAQGEGLFWVASPKRAAVQILQTIKAKKRCAYVTKRWRLIGWLLKRLPEALYARL